MAALALLAGCGRPEWTWHASTDGYAFSVDLARGGDDRLWVSQRELNGQYGDLASLDLGGTEQSDRRLVASDGQVWLHAVSAGEDGAVNIAGEFEGTLSFGPGEERTSAACSGPSLGCSDAFVASYDPDGELRWVTVYSEDGNDRVVALASSGGRTVLLGTLAGQDSSPLGDTIEEDLRTVFVATLDGAGEELWALRYDEERGYAEVGDVLVDRQGAIWFSAGSWSAAPVPLFTAHLAQVLPGGTEVRRLAAPLAALALADDGDLILGSTFRDQTALGTETLTAAGSTDGVIARLDPLSGAVRWHTQLAGAGSDEVTDVAVDPAGDVVLVGRTTGSLALGNDPIVGAPGEAALVVARLGGADGHVIRGVGAGSLGVGASARLVVLGRDDLVVAATANAQGDPSSSDEFVRRFDPFAAN